MYRKKYTSKHETLKVLNREEISLVHHSHDAKYAKQRKHY